MEIDVEMIFALIIGWPVMMLVLMGIKAYFLWGKRKIGNASSKSLWEEVRNFGRGLLTSGSFAALFSISAESSVIQLAALGLLGLFFIIAGVTIILLSLDK